MLGRLLMGVLASALSDQSTDAPNDTHVISLEDRSVSIIYDRLRAPGKFHIGMLTLSLITGLAYGGFITYNCWMEQDVFRSYIRNLVIALVCRTFFTILFEGVVILGSPSVGGANALLTFENICTSLVLAFWLTFTIYMHARVQRNFNSEPSLRLYQFGVPGTAVFFTLVWVFVIQSAFPNFYWIFIYLLSPTSLVPLYTYLQWVVNSLRVMYMLVQLGLVADMTRMIMKFSVDNDGVSLLRKIAAMMASLLLLFWLQFGLSIGEPILTASSGYLYFFYFIDGLQCGLVCVILYFFDKWVPILCKTLGTGTQASPREEALINGTASRGIVTVDSVFTTRESGSLGQTDFPETNDIVYSSLVQPPKLKKTLDLYKRLNVIPTNEVTVFEGDKFFECDLLSVGRSNSDLTTITPKESPNVKSNQNGLEFDKTQKKNAFYSSKYLILEPKKLDIPKELETRPSLSPSGKGSPKEERNGDMNYPRSDWLNDNDFVQKWVKDQCETNGKTLEEASIKVPDENESAKEEKERAAQTERASTDINDSLSDDSKSNSVKDVFSVISNIFGKISGAGTDQTSASDDVDPINRIDRQSKKTDPGEDDDSDHKTFTSSTKFMKNPDTTDPKDSQISKANHDTPSLVTPQQDPVILSPRALQESDSEFEIEKRKQSSSTSASSFDMDTYYAQINACREKLMSGSKYKMRH